MKNRITECYPSFTAVIAAVAMALSSHAGGADYRIDAHVLAGGGGPGAFSSSGFTAHTVIGQPAPVFPNPVSDGSLKLYSGYIWQMQVSLDPGAEIILAIDDDPFLKCPNADAVTNLEIAIMEGGQDITDDYSQFEFNITGMENCAAAISEVINNYAVLQVTDITAGATRGTILLDVSADDPEGGIITASYGIDVYPDSDCDGLADQDDPDPNDPDVDNDCLPDGSDPDPISPVPESMVFTSHPAGPVSRGVGYDLGWEAIQGSGYELLEAEENDVALASLIWSGTETFARIAGKPGDGSYFYWVRAIAVCGEFRWEGEFSESVEVVVSGTSTVEYTFTLYHTESGNENWISIPVDTAYITDTRSLGESIASSFTPEFADSIIIEIRDNRTQTSQSTTGDYFGAWEWDNNQLLATGAMVKVYISHPSGLPEFSVEWTVRGTVPAVDELQFTLHHTSDGNENWISIPVDTADITDTRSLGESIASSFTPEFADSIIIEIRDNRTQTSQSTTGDYFGAWEWDNNQQLEPALPIVTYISHPDGIPLEINWP